MSATWEVGPLSRLLLRKCYRLQYTNFKGKSRVCMCACVHVCVCVILMGSCLRILVRSCQAFWRPGCTLAAVCPASFVGQLPIFPCFCMELPRQSCQSPNAPRCAVPAAAYPHEFLLASPKTCTQRAATAPKKDYWVLKAKG